MSKRRGKVIVPFNVTNQKLTIYLRRKDHIRGESVSHNKRNIQRDEINDYITVPRNIYTNTPYGWR